MKKIPHSFGVQIDILAEAIKSHCSTQALGAKVYFDKLMMVFYPVYKECLNSTNNKNDLDVYDQEMRKIFDSHFQKYNLGGMISDYSGNFQELKDLFHGELNNILKTVMSETSTNAKKEFINTCLAWVTCGSAVAAAIIGLMQLHSSGYFS